MERGRALNVKLVKMNEIELAVNEKLQLSCRELAGKGRRIFLYHVNVCLVHCTHGFDNVGNQAVIDKLWDQKRPNINVNV